MADYPCDMHNSRYQGPSFRLYLNIYSEDQVAAFRYSVCGPCLSALTQEWVGKAIHQTPGGSWDPPVDGEALEDLWQAPRPSRSGFARR